MFEQILMRVWVGDQSGVFDFIGTLAVVQGYSSEGSIQKMYESLFDNGFETDYKRFRKAYHLVHRKYRLLRYEKLREVTNAVWLSEALNRLGFATKPRDEAVKKAVNVYFEDYLRSLKPRPCALRTLKTLSNAYSLALLSNFTYAPVIYAGLRKLRFNPYFSAVLVSEEVGWRKPHPNIFKEALKRTGAEAQQTMFVGDSPIEDIQGAKGVKMNPIFIPSQFFTIEDAQRAPQKPDVILDDLCELPQLLSQM